MSSTRVTHHLKASRASTYRALLDPHAIAKWKVPNGMTCRMHAFDVREGGLIGWALAFRSAPGAILAAFITPLLLARIRSKEALLRSQSASNTTPTVSALRG